jgi:ferredoxin-NADP reductase
MGQGNEGRMSNELTVAGVHWHCDGIFEIVFERNGLEFVPGDCLALFGEDGICSRPYSVASGIGENELRFVIRRMDEGQLSAYLSTRSPGDRVKASPPFGWFRPGPNEKDAPFVFVATGTGISPFLSHFFSRPEIPPAMCLYGVRHLQDAVGIRMIGSRCNLQLAVSGERSPGTHHGRVTDLLDDMPCAPDHHYFLCGLDAMIDEVSAWLEEHGVPIMHIHRECFFNVTHSH